MMWKVWMRRPRTGGTGGVGVCFTRHRKDWVEVAAPLTLHTKLSQVPLG